jgi:hypothetical protein
MPRKTFVAGDVLTASDMNTFLMDQSVMTFADSTARASAIGTATEGMLTYLEDTKAYEYWDGTAYEPLVGAATSGLNLITTASFSGAVSHSYGSDANPIFTTDYDNYKIILTNMKLATTSATLEFRLRANTTDLTSSQYSWQVFQSSGTATVSVRTSPATSFDLNFVGNDVTNNTVVELFNPATSLRTGYISESQQLVPGAGVAIIKYAGYEFSGAAYNGFTIFSSNNLSGTLSVYGYKK